MSESSITRYSTIVIDPPWRYRSVVPFYSTGQQQNAPAKGIVVRYGTLSHEQIAALPTGGNFLPRFVLCGLRRGGAAGATRLS